MFSETKKCCLCDELLGADRVKEIMFILQENSEEKFIMNAT